MSVEAFLDTNVLVYCFEPGEPANNGGHGNSWSRRCVTGLPGLARRSCGKTDPLFFPLITLFLIVFVIVNEILKPIAFSHL
jgi:hypothetical protein